MKNGKEKPAAVERKVDTRVNGDKVLQAVENQKKREKKLFPLRIDSRTVIYVSKNKCNSEYAQKYKEKIDSRPPLKGTAAVLQR